MRRVHRLALALLAASCAVLLDPGGARADELLRCLGPDGKMIYTDDKSVCPDAEPFEPEGHVTKAVPSPRAASGAARTAPARASWNDQVEEAEAERWRAKKASKLAELEAVKERRDGLKRFVRICNRRGRVIRYDAAGIEREVPCSQIQQEFAAFDAQEAEIREYLERGLVDECRRAGCLPGWIR